MAAGFADSGLIFSSLIDEETKKEPGKTTSRLCVRVSLGTYKLFYAAGTEDCIVRRRTVEMERTLQGRAAAREEERRRSKWLK